MTIEKMKAGRRTPRNPVIMEVMRDYGYVDARGMGIRTKVIPLTRKYAGVDPVFEATDDFLRTVIPVGRVLENGSTSVKTSLKKGGKFDNVPEKSLEMPFQGQLLSLIKGNPRITYDELAAQTRRNRKTVQRRLQTLKKKGLLRRLGSAKGGQWEAVILRLQKDIFCESVASLAVFIIHSLRSFHINNSFRKYIVLKYGIYIRQCAIW
jgi:ATP-dependent DNA helicase RecG